MKAAALQQAIYDALTLENTLGLDFTANSYTVTTGATRIPALLSQAYLPLPAVFTDVPQSVDAEKDTDFPFITIGGDTITPFEDKDNPGGNAVVQIDIWDRATSMIDLKTVADAVDARLRRQTLSISGVTHITTELDSSVFTRDPDGKTKRALLLYRVLWIA